MMQNTVQLLSGLAGGVGDAFVAGLSRCVATGMTTPTLGQAYGANGMNWLDKLWLRAPEASSDPTASGRVWSTDYMFMWLWWFCVIWFVGLMGLMVYFVVKYRRRPGKIAEMSPAHNTKLEIGWTVIPTLFLVLIFFKGFDGYMNKMTPSSGGVELWLRGWKWNWEMTYPNGATISSETFNKTIGSRPVPVFYVPAQTPINLRMNSSDVMHAFWIPDLRIKSDVIPNRFTGLTFSIGGPAVGFKHPSSKDEAKDPRANPHKLDYIEDLAGIPYEDHWVFCAEYCGEEHSEMAAIIRVIPKDKFPAWLAVAAAGGKAPENIQELAALGKKIYTAKCASCHSLDGSIGTGPSWKNLFGYEREFSNAPPMMADENYVMESIRIPAAKIRKGYSNGMTPWTEDLLPTKSVYAILAFMRSAEMSDKGGDMPMPGGSSGTNAKVEPMEKK